MLHSSRSTHILRGFNESATAGGCVKDACSGVSSAAGSIGQVIAKIWSELLQLPQVEVHDNFFSLGGDSLLAIRYLSRVRENLHILLSLSDFFANATVAQQAMLIGQRLCLGVTPSDARSGAQAGLGVD